MKNILLVIMIAWTLFMSLYLITASAALEWNPFEWPEGTGIVLGVLWCLGFVAVVALAWVWDCFKND